VGKPEGKRPLGRSRRRWADIKMALKRNIVGWYALDRAQWRAPVNTVTNFRVPYNVGKFLSRWKTGGFSKRAQLHEVNVA
jgi:hypothetical protein